MKMYIHIIYTLYMYVYIYKGFLGGTVGKEPACQFKQET